MQIPNNNYHLIKSAEGWIISRINNESSSSSSKLSNKLSAKFLTLGDFVEYVDSDLSFSEDNKFIGTVYGKVIEISEKEVLVTKPNRARLLVGNNSKFVNHISYSEILKSNNLKKLSKIISLSLLILFVIFSIIWIYIALT